MPKDIVTERDDRLLLKPEEAARLLGVGRTSVYELIARGELRTVMIGRCRRVTMSSIRALVDRLVDHEVRVQLSPVAAAESTDTAWLYDRVASRLRSGVASQTGTGAIVGDLSSTIDTTRSAPRGGG